MWLPISIQLIPELNYGMFQGGTRRADTEVVISKETPNSHNFAVCWVANPFRELVDETTIISWNWKKRRTIKLLEAEMLLQTTV